MNARPMFPQREPREQPGRSFGSIAMARPLSVWLRPDSEGGVFDSAFRIAYADYLARRGDLDLADQVFE
jgi:hypothetical protein